MVSWREIGRGIYRRFLPAVVVTDIVLSLPAWIVTHAPPSLAATAVGLSSLVLGYATVLGLIRTHLRSDAGIDGRRSVVAGVASLGLIVAGAATFRLGGSSLFGSVVRLGGLYFGSSVLVTLGLYFPWIGARRADIAETGAVAELAPPMPSGATAAARRDRVR
jgi:hypothetical protein